MTRNSTYVVDANHTYMMLDNTLWLKVFYHNTTFGNYFSYNNEEEALDSHTERKFSILGTIDSSFLINKKYEFLYEVPGVRGYNRWRQSKHPKDTYASITPEENGFQPKKLWWPSDFIGLRKCKSGSIYCGSKNIDFWWFTIGANTHNTIVNTMPLIHELHYHSYEVALWIRIPPTKGIDGFKASCRQRFNRYQTNIFIVSLLLS